MDKLHVPHDPRRIATRAAIVTAIVFFFVLTVWLLARAS